MAATKGTFTEEELDAVLMFYRKAFSCSYEETSTIKANAKQLYPSFYIIKAHHFNQP